MITWTAKVLLCLLAWGIAGSLLVSHVTTWVHLTPREVAKRQAIEDDAKAAADKVMFCYHAWRNMRRHEVPDLCRW